MAQELKERIRESVYRSRKKRWYERWTGRFAIVLSAGFIVILVIFSYFVAFHYKRIVSGDAFADTVGGIKQAARIDLLQNGNDPFIGPLDAKIVIVAFEDFECPFCRRAQPFIKNFLIRYAGDVRFIYKDFPLSTIHPNAQGAAEAAQCAFEQGKFWEFHDELFANQERLSDAYYRVVAKNTGLNITQFNECFATGKYKAAIAEDVELGRSLGAVGTPTWFLNGEFFFQGYAPEADPFFDQAIEYIKSL